MNRQDPFPSGVGFSYPGVEREKWVYGTREFLVRRVCGALSQLAEAEVTQSRTAAATGCAERSYTLADAPERETDELGRLYMLLVGGGNSHTATLRREAEEVAITLIPATDHQRNPSR